MGFFARKASPLDTEPECPGPVDVATSLAKWGMLDAELADKEGIDGICPVFTEDLRPACQRASDEIRAVELSPSEGHALTSAWWGSTQP